uniref:GPI inositol-deacylase n=1 Tax=Phytophthora ramorum TaxID=164328 RepID=H3GVY0_PHYRM
MQLSAWFTFAATFVSAIILRAPSVLSWSQDGTQGPSATLADASSVHLRIMLYGKNMNIHGQSVFNVFAKPIVSANGSNVRYDGFATFIQGDSQFTYLLVDGAAYVVESLGNDTTSAVSQTVRCLSSIAPFDSIVSALNTLKVVPSTPRNEDGFECAGGTLLKTATPFGREDFTVCASGPSGFIAYGGNIKMSVEYLDYQLHKISTPKLSDGDTSCGVVSTPTSVTPSALALLTGDSISSDNSRKLKTSAGMASTCSCMITPRPCIFLHGLGNPNEEAELQDSPDKTNEKMGDIGDHAPCCSTIKYAVLNTVDYAWTNPTLQQKFCDHSLSMSDTSDLTSRTIQDTIVVTHSMGGLAMAGALANGVCSFGEDTLWVSLSAPMMGSMAVDYLQDICEGEINPFVKTLFSITGDCHMSPARLSTCYQNGRASSPELNAAYAAAQEAYRGNVSAAICSTSYNGVMSKFTISSVIGGTVIPHKSPENDGLIEFQSCLGGLSPSLFGDSYLYRFYAAELNHADTGFLTHDGVFKDSQKPFRWFECLFGSTD